jgi:hypothetical protein
MHKDNERMYGKPCSQLSFVQYRPLDKKELLDMPIEQYLASWRFEQREKLDQLGVKTGSYLIIPCVLLAFFMSLL